MTPGQLLALARLGLRTAVEVATPLSHTGAADDVRSRMRSRERRFLDALDACVFGRAGSPVGNLLRWAGYDGARIRQRVGSVGLEPLLSELHAAGVRVSADELEGRRPITRDGFTIPGRTEQFFNPTIAGPTFSAKTSGSGGKPRRVPYGWALFNEEAAEEALLLECHGLEDAPVAFWYPGPPGIAGVHNLLLHWKLGLSPRRWFSQVPAPRLSDGPALRVAFEGLSAIGLARRSPRPRFVPPEAAAEVARWLAAGTATAERRLLRAHVSSAVRAARAAANGGIDISGNTVFVGGEPLTAERERILRDQGLAVVARYVSTESGLIAGACDQTAAGAMHLYSDRLAVLVDGKPPAAHSLRGPVALTSLSTSSPLVLLNAELGDHAVVTRTDCPCPFGRAGFDVQLDGVRAPGKIAASGVKFPAARFAALAAEVARLWGGAPDDVQVGWRQGRDGLVRIRITLSERVDVPSSTFRQRFLQELGALPSGPLAQKLWSEDELRVVRDEPTASSGHKHSPFVIDTP